MNKLPRDLRLEVLKYLHIKDFINMCFLNKKHINLCKKYLKYKKREFKREKKKKTYKNCLYKLKDPTCNDEICIVKIVKLEEESDDDKKKITFWVITKMCKIGKNNEFKYYVYPNWCKVRSIENKDLIPFY
jgi:hypothetical protein